MVCVAVVGYCFAFGGLFIVVLPTGGCGGVVVCLTVYFVGLVVGCVLVISRW